jgi:uncharacterized protein with FMN-binding domain
MSRPRFMVFKLKELRLPLIMVMIAVAAVVFFMYANKPATETFAPSNTHEDGVYIASLSLTDAYFDVVVNVEDSLITSIALENIDENEMSIYPELASSISFLNDYVTATQSLELPGADNLSVSTVLLMDAVQVALSDDPEAMLTTTYLNPSTIDLSVQESLAEDAGEEINEEFTEDLIMDLTEEILEENLLELSENE